MAKNDGRPATLDDVKGQDSAVAAVRRVLSANGGDPGGTAWYITGDSGTGKTSIADVLAEMMGCEGVIRQSVGKLTPARAAELFDQTSSRNLFGGWAIVVDECHNLRQDTLAELKRLLDTGRIPDCTVWVFTTTVQEQAKLFGDDRSEDAVAFLSRCKPLVLANDAESQAARALHVKARAVAVGIDGYEDSVYIRAMAALKGNTRALWQEVEMGTVRQTAAKVLPVDVAKPAAKRVSGLPDEKTLRAMPLAELRGLCQERGAVAGWLASSSAATLVRWLMAKGK